MCVRIYLMSELTELYPKTFTGSYELLISKMRKSTCSCVISLYLLQKNPCHTVLTGANPFINNRIHPLLKHGFVTLTMTHQGHRINPPSLVLETVFRTLQVYMYASKEAFIYRWGRLSVKIYCLQIYVRIYLMSAILQTSPY